MILTAQEICSEVLAGNIVIEDFDATRLEPNSYGFRLGDELLTYEDECLDCREAPKTARHEIPQDGFVVQPHVLYLGATAEAMGSPEYVATLYASRSVASLGVWIQFSAPLGHTGAVFPWTLEIRATAPVRLFAGMVIGKLAFWEVRGAVTQYGGRYLASTSAVASRLSMERTADASRNH